jgi:hypothetical protein
MHPAISCELAKARIADLRHQAQRDALGSRRHALVLECTAVDQNPYRSTPRSHDDDHNR